MEVGIGSFPRRNLYNVCDGRSKINNHIFRIIFPRSNVLEVACVASWRSNVFDMTLMFPRSNSCNKFVVRLICPRSNSCKFQRNAVAVSCIFPRSNSCNIPVGDCRINNLIFPRSNLCILLLAGFHQNAVCYWNIYPGNVVFHP